MPFDESLAQRIRQNLVRRKNIEEKKMFGGIGFLRNGNLFLGIWKNELLVRLDPEIYEEALLEPYVKEFNITGKSMKGWVLVEPDGLIHEEQLTEWIQRAWQFVCQLPVK